MSNFIVQGMFFQQLHWEKSNETRFEEGEYESKAVWNVSENSSDLVAPSFPYTFVNPRDPILRRNRFYLSSFFLNTYFSWHHRRMQCREFFKCFSEKHELAGIFWQLGGKRHQWFQPVDADQTKRMSDVILRWRKSSDTSPTYGKKG